MTIQLDMELSDELHTVCPLFRDALRHVGHQQTRSRGTVGGSLVHADPAAELPAVALVLDAEMVARGRSGVRTIKAEDFFPGPYVSGLADDEILIEVSFGVPVGTRTGFMEFSRRAGDFALGGVAVALRARGDDGTVDDARIAAFGAAGAPVRLHAAEAVLRASQLTDPVVMDASRIAAEEISPIASHGVSEAYRRRLIGVLVQRVLKEMSA